MTFRWKGREWLVRFWGFQFRFEGLWLEGLLSTLKPTLWQFLPICSFLSSQGKGYKDKLSRELDFPVVLADHGLKVDITQGEVQIQSDGEFGEEIVGWGRVQFYWDRWLWEKSAPIQASVQSDFTHIMNALSGLPIADLGKEASTLALVVMLLGGAWPRVGGKQSGF